MARRRSFLLAAATAITSIVLACVGDDPGSSSSGSSSGGSPDAQSADVGGPDTTPGGGDAGGDSATPRCDLAKPFAIEAVTELNSALPNAGARLSRDELTVYWHRGDAPGNLPPITLWVAKRSTPTGVFSSLQPVVGLAKPDGGSDLFPTLMPNGDLLFHSDRSGTSRDVYVSKLVGGTYTAPTPFPPLNKPGVGERSPYVSIDGKEIFITYDDPDAGPGQSHVAISQETAPGVYGNPTVISLGTGTTEFSPVVSADRTLLYFARGTQMFTSKRASVGAPWGPPQPVTELNTGDSSSQPTWVSDDGCILYFHGNRPQSDPVVRVFRGAKPQ
jgi:hypothetical protein